MPTGGIVSHDTAYDQTYQFLCDLFGGVDGSLWVYLWTLSNRKSHWFKAEDLTRMAEAAQFLKGRDNVYVGASISPSNFGTSNRCQTSDSAGIVGLWADIDVASGAHKKKNLPTTRAEAAGLSFSIIKPTIIVDSGHGIQPWWLFKEPWVFSDSKERFQACNLIHSWQCLIRTKAKAKGWTIDATHDLARVFRVPGTLNSKTKDVVDVKIIHREDGLRYDPTDFPARVEAIDSDDDSEFDRGYPGGFPNAAIGSVVIQEAATISHELLATLFSTDDHARKAWSRTLKRDDCSPSVQDFHLAYCAASANWPAQDVVNLLIHCRRTNKDDMKYPGYYHRTVSKAFGMWSRDVKVINDIAETEHIMAAFGKDGF